MIVQIVQTLETASANYLCQMGGCFLPLMGCLLAGLFKERMNGFHPYLVGQEGRKQKRIHFIVGFLVKVQALVLGLLDRLGSNAVLVPEPNFHTGEKNGQKSW